MISNEFSKQLKSLRVDGSWGVGECIYLTNDFGYPTVDATIFYIAGGKFLGFKNNVSGSLSIKSVTDFYPKLPSRSRVADKEFNRVFAPYLSVVDEVANSTGERHILKLHVTASGIRVLPCMVWMVESLFKDKLGSLEGVSDTEFRVGKVEDLLYELRSTVGNDLRLGYVMDIRKSFEVAKSGIALIPKLGIAYFRDEMVNGTVMDLAYSPRHLQVMLGDGAEDLVRLNGLVKISSNQGYNLSVLDKHYIEEGLALTSMTLHKHITEGLTYLNSRLKDNECAVLVDGVIKKTTWSFDGSGNLVVDF